MTTLKKLPSGKWRTRVIYYDEAGNRRFKTFTQSTKAECQYAASKWEKEHPRGEKSPVSETLGEAVDKYIKQAEVLSPTTINGYKVVREYAFQSIMDAPIESLDLDRIQAAINEECRRPGRNGQKLSPKTIKNEWGLIAAVLRQHNKVFNVKLPKPIVKQKELPEPEEVINAIRGSNCELPCMLAIWLSFSESEIRGLKYSSIRNGYIHIDQVKVCIKGVDEIKKQGKVPTRNRKLALPDYIYDLIKQTPGWQKWDDEGIDDFIIDYSAVALYHRWKRIADKNEWDMTFHDLRHMNASIMEMLGVPQKYAQERGGWSNNGVLTKVYQHTFDEKRKSVDNKIDDFFKESISCK